MNVYDMFNIVDKPTCFKTENNTLLDVILTSNKKRIASTLNINTCISDFHSLVAFSSKMPVPKTGDQNIQYRSYKHFDDELFKDDIASAPYLVGDIFDDFDDTYWFNHTLIKMLFIIMLHLNQKGLLKDHYHLRNYVKLAIEISAKI